jgi:hypothetical protein
VSSLNDQWTGLDRRSGADRRIGDRRNAVHSQSSRPYGPPAVDRRSGERRQGERRAGALASVVDPRLTCPSCGGPLEYEPFLSWIAPATYTVDTGYCPNCSRRFFRTRETGQYDPLSWPPLCRICREPLAYVPRGSGAGGEGETLSYHCRFHSEEEWAYRPGTDQWTSVRSAAPTRVYSS